MTKITNEVELKAYLAEHGSVSRFSTNADLVDANLVRADLSGANLSGANLVDADLSGANLSGANLSGADLSGANLRGANLVRADLVDADLRGANLVRADLVDADLSAANLVRADLSGANLYDANLVDADLSAANLVRADLSGANLSGADLSYADLSGAKGLLNPIDYLKDNFEHEIDDNGNILAIYVYKIFGLHYATPDTWTIEKGAILREVVNPLPTVDCGSGINVAKISWFNFRQGEVWKVRIAGLAMAGIVVPYNTDGKIRCSECELVEIVKSEV